jgi:rubrerythrin
METGNEKYAGTKVICPKCGTAYDRSMDRCPECGAVRADESLENTNMMVCD